MIYCKTTLPQTIVRCSSVSCSPLLALTPVLCRTDAPRDVILSRYDLKPLLARPHSRRLVRRRECTCQPQWKRSGYRKRHRWELALSCVFLFIPSSPLVRSKLTIRLLPLSKAAAYCNLWTLKPTTGRVPVAGSRGTMLGTELMMGAAGPLARSFRTFLFLSQFVVLSLILN